MNCSTCGKEVTGKFCSGCGAEITVQAPIIPEVPQQATCATCGSVADGKFCGTCGASLPEAAPQPAPADALAFAAPIMPSAAQAPQQAYAPPQQEYQPQQSYAAPPQAPQAPAGQYTAQQQYAYNAQPAYAGNAPAAQSQRKRKPIVPIIIIVGVLLAAAAVFFIFFFRFAPSSSKFQSVMTKNGYVVTKENSSISAGVSMGFSIKEAYKATSSINNTDFMYVRMGSSSQAEDLYKMYLLNEKIDLDSDDILKETGGVNYKSFIITDTYSEYIDGMVRVGDVLIYIDGYLDEKVAISAIMSGLGFSGIL